MCQVNVGEMSNGLWTVAIERCFGNPARKDVVTGPRHSEREAISAGEALVEENNCAVSRVVVNRIQPKRGMFD